MGGTATNLMRLPPRYTNRKTNCFTAGHEAVVQREAGELETQHYALLAGGALCLTLAGHRLRRCRDEDEIDAALLADAEPEWYADDLWGEFDDMPRPIELPRRAAEPMENAAAVDGPAKTFGPPTAAPATGETVENSSLGRESGKTSGPAAILPDRSTRPAAVVENSAADGTSRRTSRRLKGHLLHPLTLTLLALACLLPVAVRQSETEHVTAMRPIEQVRAGDLVLARAEHGTHVRPMPVLHSFVRTSDHLRLLTLHTAGGTDTIRTTDEHPFWVPECGWVEAKNLQSGDELVGQDGGAVAWVQATGRIARPDGVRVFNFEVTGHHTYFVRPPGARGPPVLVHNSDCPPKDSLDLGDIDHAGNRDLWDDLPRRSDMGSGTYTIDFESGMKYHDKGLEERMRRSARERAARHGDTVKGRSFTPSDSEREAFIEEARRIAEDGGIGSGRLYNEINSPGRRMTDNG